MRPKLSNRKYVFCNISKDNSSLEPLLSFKEDEGTTLILEKENADNNSLHYSGIWAKITLTVHSDLKAVGFLAAIVPKLAEKGITVNIISAYYHDHLFVPYDKAEEAMRILENISQYQEN